MCLYNDRYRESIVCCWSSSSRRFTDYWLESVIINLRHVKWYQPQPTVWPDRYVYVSVSVCLSVCHTDSLTIDSTSSDSNHSPLSDQLDMSLCLCLAVCLSVYVSDSPSLSPSNYLGLLDRTRMFLYLCVCLSVCLSVYMSVCLSVCVSDSPSLSPTSYLGLLDRTRMFLCLFMLTLFIFNPFAGIVKLSRGFPASSSDNAVRSAGRTLLNSDTSESGLLTLLLNIRMLI